jgi:hypothetical protein
VALTVKLKAATTILDRVGLSERSAIERTQQLKAAENARSVDAPPPSPNGFTSCDLSLKRLSKPVMLICRTPECV